MSSFVQRYLLPGFVFQGVVIGGGYATGRELVEFFLPSGPLGGLLGMLVAALIWSVVMAITFELCRVGRTYDYRSFFRGLIGRFWFSYEALLLGTMILTLAVIGAASGEIIRDRFGLNEWVGSASMTLTIAVLAFQGTRTIERFMAAWSLLLYAVYIVLIARSMYLFGDQIVSNFSSVDVGSRWIVDGVRYAGYNVAAVPVVLFCLRHQRTRKEAVYSGLLGGLLAIFPGVIFYIALMVGYPSIGSESIPALTLLDMLDMNWFNVVFEIVLLGALLQTGIGLVHTVNERIDATLIEYGKNLARVFRPVVALSILFVALVLAAKVGIIRLVADGYGVVTWGFIAVFVVPTITVGLARVLRGDQRELHKGHSYD